MSNHYNSEQMLCDFKWESSERSRVSHSANFNTIRFRTTKDPVNNVPKAAAEVFRVQTEGSILQLSYLSIPRLRPKIIKKSPVLRPIKCPLEWLFDLTTQYEVQQQCNYIQTPLLTLKIQVYNVFNQIMACKPHSRWFKFDVIR